VRERRAVIAGTPRSRPSAARHNPHPETMGRAGAGAGNGPPTGLTTRGSSPWQEGRPFHGRRAGLGEGTSVTLARGAVVLVELNPTVWHEQRGVALEFQTEVSCAP
jgi:hypothetical protein